MVTPLSVIQNGPIISNDEMIPTLIINPNNPPPWIQNRQTQPQVVYIQQPFGYLPQQIDQQVYIQNYSCQNPAPQMFISNYDQVRPYQIQMALNPDPNLSNERIFVQNVAPNDPNAYAPVQNEVNPLHYQNISNQSYNINSPESIAVPQVQVQSYIQANSIVPNQNPNVTTVSRQLNEHSFSNPNIPRDNKIPTNMPPRPVANTTIKPPIMTVQNQTQTYRPSGSNIRMMRSNNVTVTPSLPPAITYQNTRPPLPRQSISIIRNNVIRTPRLTYRPIQPRPIGVRTQVINPTMQMQFVPSYNVPNLNNPGFNLTQNQSTNVQTSTENTIVSRKRKSESPDEIQNKLKVLGLNNNPILRGHLANNPIKTVDVGISTNCTKELTIVSSANKNVTPVNTISVTTQVKKEDLVVPANGTVQLPDAQETTNQNQSLQSQHLLEREKLRSTLYPQARGRILNDKSTEPPQENTQSENKIELQETSCVQIDNNVESESQLVVSEPIIIEKEVIKENINDNKIKKTNLSFNKTKNNTIDMKLTEKDYVLTHVLDGFVIQESNVAFPIQKPVKKRTIKLTKEKDDALNRLIEYTNEINSEIKKNKEPAIENDKSQYSDKKIRKMDEGNPFSTLCSKKVKSWTVDDLSRHLEKCGWRETASVFSEHEIDGESMFLVAKSQLLCIGVTESHADFIIEFINS